MTLLYKPDMLPYEIYDVAYDSTGFPLFLIFRNNQWCRRSAKHFTPNFYEDGMGRYRYNTVLKQTKQQGY